MRHVFHRDSRPAIFDLDGDESVVGPRPHAHPSAVPAVTDRVGDQVLHCASDGGAIPANRRRVIASDFDVHSALVGEPATLRNGFVDRLARIDDLVALRRAARFHSAKLQYFIDEIDQTVRLLDDRLAVTRGVHRNAVGEILTRGCERGERRVKLVSDSGDEFDLLPSQSFGAASR